MPASFILSLTLTQLEVVRDALTTVGNMGTGHFESAQEWWGNVGDHGDFGTMLRERLEKVGKVAQHAQCRGIKDAPDRARMAWDLAAVIRASQAARRLKKPVELALLPRVGKGPLARVDCIQPGTRTFMASLDTLKDVPAAPGPKKKYPDPPAVPALFPSPLVTPKKGNKTRALLKKKKANHHA